MADYRELALRFKDVLAMRTSPVALYYADTKPQRALGFKGVIEGSCIISPTYRVSAEGETAAFDANNYGCPGAGRCLGFIESARPDLAEFLSCGIEGELEGERYIKTPELAQAFLDRRKIRTAPAKYCIFAPLDRLEEGVDPEVIVFFVRPDVLSALVVLADYENPLDRSNTVVRFASGCGQIVTEPLIELEKENPRAVLGMFDISARPSVPPDVLTYAVPTALFIQMASNIEGSFLETESWHKVRVRNLEE